MDSQMAESGLIGVGWTAYVVCPTVFEGDFLRRAPGLWKGSRVCSIIDAAPREVLTPDGGILSHGRD